MGPTPQPLAGGSIKAKGSFRHKAVHAMLPPPTTGILHWLFGSHYCLCCCNRQSWHRKCNHCLNKIWALHVLQHRYLPYGTPIRCESDKSIDHKQLGCITSNHATSFMKGKAPKDAD